MNPITDSAHNCRYPQERKPITAAEELARFFHETYEDLAPLYSYVTREASAVPWEHVPENNKRLMIAVAERVLAHLGLVV